METFFIIRHVFPILNANGSRPFGIYMQYLFVPGKEEFILAGVNLAREAFEQSDA